MSASPLVHVPLFSIGPVHVTAAVAVTWAIVAGLAAASAIASRRLSVHAPSRWQAALELFVEGLDAQIAETMRVPPAPYRALLGGLFVFILLANWTALLPGIHPPTAQLETDAALAGIVFAASLGYGVRERGVIGYLKTLAEPTLVMVPLNVVERITRTLSMTVRLFGNVVSGVFVVGIVLSMAGLLVPIPLMALDLLAGTVQAYIFTVLAMVFIGETAGPEEGQEGGHGTSGNQTLEKERA